MNEEKSMKVIIDTDIGDDIDDAYALILAANTAEIELIGVTTVYRNAEQRAKIAAALLGCLNRKIPVAAGADYPYNTPFRVEAYEKKLADGRPVIPHYFPEFEGEKYSSVSAEELILSSAERYPGEVTVAAIGPMTNLARAYEKDPVRFGRLKEIVCMGGCFGSAFAEWNVRCDAEAAAKVLKSGVGTTMIGIDVTKYTFLTAEQEARLVSVGGPAFVLAARMLKKMHADIPSRITTLHDVLAIAELTNSFCRYEERRAGVLLEGGARGRIAETPDGAAIKAAVGVDRDAFMKYFFDKIENRTVKKFA